MYRREFPRDVLPENGPGSMITPPFNILVSPVFSRMPVPSARCVSFALPITETPPSLSRPIRQGYARASSRACLRSRQYCLAMVVSPQAPFMNFTWHHRSPPQQVFAIVVDRADTDIPSHQPVEPCPPATSRSIQNGEQPGARATFAGSARS